VVKNAPNPPGRAGCEQQAAGELEQAGPEPADLGDGGDEHGAAGVAELTADLGGARGLAEPARRRSGGQGGEAATQTVHALHAGPGMAASPCAVRAQPTG
jgi:hypothetical protein